MTAARSAVPVRPSSGTLTGNNGGHEAIFGGSGVSFANSILDDAPAVECNAAVTDGGHNVASDATCALGSTSIPELDHHRDADASRRTARPGL